MAIKCGLIRPKEGVAQESFEREIPPAFYPYFSLLDGPLEETRDSGHRFVLYYDKEHLKLQFWGEGHKLTPKWRAYEIDFHEYWKKFAQSPLRKSDPLIRALGKQGRPQKGAKILDLTGGTGKDSLFLLFLGHEVTCLERHPVMFLMLKNAYQRGLTQLSPKKSLAEALANRFHLFFSEATEFIDSTPGSFDVAFLDPMFPPKTKTALAKKEMQLLHELLCDDPHDSSVLVKALEKKIARYIIVKRPLHAPPLGSLHPLQSFAGKAVRFDRYQVFQASI